MSGHNFENLKAHILLLSNAQQFDSARTEWHLVAVEISEEPDHCPCGQQIHEHCYIQNRLNGNETYVGNVCINRFIKIDTGTLFDGLKRIAKDPYANPNQALIDYARRRGYLYSEKEYVFLTQTMRSRSLSQSQLDWKAKINRRILKGIVVRKRTVR